MAESQLRLGGKVALVTGAARGLGLAFAEAMIQEGAKVVLAARSEDLLRAEAKRLGHNALAVRMDISDPESVRAGFREAAVAFGDLDVLVNNATLNHIHRISEVTDEELKAEVGVNILGSIYCMREAIAQMSRRGGGDIINISSESVLRPYPFLSLYAACKSAIESLAVGMREELRSENIRVATLRSGLVGGSGDFHAGVPPERLQEFRRISRERYYPQASGTAISPTITARALIDLICTPREAHVDFISVRSI